MPATSIEDTGAKIGDTVRCVKMLETGQPGRFHEGNTYQVVMEAGALKAFSHLTDPTIKGKSVPMAWRGYGFEWELVGAA